MSDPGQYQRSHLENMTPDEIAEAKQQGRLDYLLGRPSSDPDGYYIFEADD